MQSGAVCIDTAELRTALLRRVSRAMGMLNLPPVDPEYREFQQQEAVGHRGAETVHEPRQVVGAHVYDEVSILKGLRDREGDHPEGATETRIRRVGPDADRAQADLDGAADDADEGRVDLRGHWRSSVVLGWYG